MSGFPQTDLPHFPVGVARGRHRARSAARYSLFLERKLGDSPAAHLRNIVREDIGVSASKVMRSFQSDRFRRHQLPVPGLLNGE